MHGELAADQVYVTVDLLLLTVWDGTLTLLLSRRTHPPYDQRWALPGHFIAIDASAEKTADELLREMLPAEGVYKEQLYTFTELNRDPRGRVISLAYLALAPRGKLEEALARPENTFSRFAVQFDGKLRLTGEDGEELAASDLAFDHGRIVETGIRRLQGKIDYTDIGFYLLEDQQAFTLTELQTVHEAVLGDRLDDSNFRRQIQNRYMRTGFVVQTKARQRNGQGRPAWVYKRMM